MMLIILFSLFVIPLAAFACAWWYSAAYIKNVRSMKPALAAGEGPSRPIPGVDRAEMGNGDGENSEEVLAGIRVTIADNEISAKIKRR